ncbi:DUF1835 domain-containing protein [Vineibacter terrae]|uniref:DUF1835 domain-containing protein n=1 Tax=Vineibacter terrae TaxID=2586908 RepID=UPI002E343B6E|nr:DUF1835 domain-containing protein [Vineibacter terrae]HEX2888139.1 DUF1835 domain-containing protein [Vineibacter terrae]
MTDAALRGDDQRFNLQQQKTRAKELRQAIARCAPEAVERVRQHHPAARDVMPADVPQRLGKLSDAQLVIARELGLASWPQLKAHVERLERARRDIAGWAPAPDADQPTMHLRCGSDIGEGLAQAGFTGGFVEFSDPYCQGPVPCDGDLVGIRSRFIATAYDTTPEAAAAKLSAQDATLARLAEGAQRIVLWFEHDSYDQLVLARVLAALGAATRPPPLDLICADRFPVTQRFIGLGQLSPAALRSLWETRRPVTAAQLRLGHAVWTALREPAPMALHAIAASGTPELPAMAGALTRHLQELPGTQDGLSLTQRLILAQLQDGPGTVSALFRATQAREPLPFLGDLMFRAVLRDMAQAGVPPVALDGATAGRPWPQQAYRLTDAGAALLAGRSDGMAMRLPERWVGGVRIAADAPGWRWSAGHDRPVRSERRQARD